MGLAIVQRICRLLGHPLDLRSKVGKGSVFRVVLPVGDASEIDATIPKVTPCRAKNPARSRCS